MSPSQVQLTPAKRPLGSKRPARLLATLVLLQMGTMPLTAHGQSGRIVPATEPPPGDQEYLVTGVGVSAEIVASPADVCPQGSLAPCILEEGGGLTIRVGYRTRGAWYAGGAYEFSRHESSNLLRLAILQQARGELRYYADLETRAAPYLALGLGIALYGNEWGADTGGVTGMFGPGMELQITRALVLGVSTYYRPLLLGAYTDSSGARRADRFLGFGLAHLIGLEVMVELRDGLARW